MRMIAGHESVSVAKILIRAQNVTHLAPAKRNTAIMFHQFDAFILACWGDPGIEVAREITRKPVVGIAEASLYVANSLGAKFGVVSTLKRTQHMVEKTIEKVGLAGRCAMALCTNLPVAATETDRDLTLDVLEQALALSSRRVPK